MSDVEKPTNDDGATMGDMADDSAEAEEDVILGDGFAVVDDDKAEDDKNDGAESPREDAPAETTSRASGEGKVEKPAKEADKVNTQPAANGVAQDQEASKPVASPTTTTTKADSKPSQAKADSKPPPAKAAATAAATAAKKSTGESKAAAAASTPVKEADKSLGGGETKDDSLVITAEDDIDVTETEEGKRALVKSPVVNGKAAARSGKARVGPPSMWVSNIARRIKATDLKRVFSKHGKVVTAKIVTNGKNYFGYVSMDSAKSIERCIKYLNHTRLGDKKITISSDRPDAPKKKAVAATKIIVKRASPAKKKIDVKAEKEVEVKPKVFVGEGEKKVVADDKKPKEKEKIKKEKDPLTLVSSTSSDAKGEETEDKEKEMEKDKPVRKRIEAPKRDETLALKRELRRLRNDVEQLKRRMLDEQAHNKTLQMRAKRFERAYKEMDEKLRQERKEREREREVLQKKNRLEQIKVDTERDILEKERMEVRRRREDLEREGRKLAEMQRAAAAAAAAAERSSHRRKSRSVTPPPRLVVSGKRLKSGDLKHELVKKARWSGDRTRTPPPPPKLTPSGEGGRSKRDHDHHHHYYEERSGGGGGGSRRDTAVYVPTGGYHHEGGREGRHRSGGGGSSSSFAPETKSTIVVPSRSSWGGALAADGWRGPPGDVPSGYGGERYRGDPYRAPSGSYSSQGGGGGGGRDDVHTYSHSRVTEHSRSETEFSRRPVHYEAAPRKY